MVNNVNNEVCIQTNLFVYFNVSFNICLDILKKDTQAFLTCGFLKQTFFSNISFFENLYYVLL